jgi:rubrerythrin
MLEAYIMVKNNNPKTLANFINCLSLLESNTSLLYKHLADKVEVPLVNSFLLQIATDSQKHAIMLKGIGESIAKPENKPKECEKKVGESWRIVETLLKEIQEKTKIHSGEFPKLAEKLTILESIMGEEYYVFVQLKTLDLMMKEINQLYNINLGSIKKLFLSIIRDEEKHRELLGEIKMLIVPKDEIDSAPIVKYQNPDAWSRSMP